MNSRICETQRQLFGGMPQIKAALRFTLQLLAALRGFRCNRLPGLCANMHAPVNNCRKRNLHRNYLYQQPPSFEIAILKIGSEFSIF